MSEERRRTEAKIVLWFQRYTSAVKSLCVLDPEKYLDNANASGIGTFDVVFCNDGVLAFTMKDSGDRLFSSTFAHFPKRSCNDIVGERMFKFNVGYGLTKIHQGILFEPNAHRASFRGVGFYLEGYGKAESIYHGVSMFQGHMLLQDDPETTAVNDLVLRQIYGNLEGSKASGVNQSIKNKVIERLSGILVEFDNIIDLSDRERDVQNFLKINPIMVYQDYIECQSEFRLGSEYVADYSFINQGLLGKDYVFVEVERPGKRLFTSSGVMSADYTQAKVQLHSWDYWISKNSAYLRQQHEKFCEMDDPIFHLIMGRSDGITTERAAILRRDMRAHNMRFSTYDDLRSRMHRFIQRLERLTAMMTA